MNAIESKILLKSWFKTGDSPTEDQFDDLISSLVGAISDTITQADVVDGKLTITYGTVGINVDGAEVATDIEINNPLLCILSPQTAGNEAIMAPATRIDKDSCTVNFGSEIKDGTYKYYLLYND